MSVTSVSSAPAASRDAQLARKVASARPAASVAADGCINSPDQQSDISDYSFYVGAWEVSENDETGRLDNSDKRGQGSPNRLSIGETSETSGGYDSELGRTLLVSPIIANAATLERRVLGDVNKGSGGTSSVYFSFSFFPERTLCKGCTAFGHFMPMRTLSTSKCHQSEQKTHGVKQEAWSIAKFLVLLRNSQTSITTLKLSFREFSP